MLKCMLLLKNQIVAPQTAIPINQKISAKFVVLNKRKQHTIKKTYCDTNESTPG